MAALAFSLRPFGTSSFRGGAFLFASSPRVSFREEGGRTRGDRGENADCSGATLVEVMVSILLLFIIFCSWAAMNNVQAVRKESFRYAAVEKAAGILDAMVAKDSFSDGKARPGFCYRLDDKGKLCRTGRTSDKTATEIHPLWPEYGDSTVGYRISAEQESGDSSGWTNGTWGVVSLYSSLSRPSTEQRPFAEFRMLLERKAGAGRDKP